MAIAIAGVGVMPRHECPTRQPRCDAAIKQDNPDGPENERHPMQLLSGARIHFLGAPLPTSGVVSQDESARPVHHLAAVVSKGGPPAMGEQPGVIGSVGEIGGIVATICKLAVTPTAANWLKVQPLSKGLPALPVPVWSAGDAMP
jgi:hypothetical protein